MVFASIALCRNTEHEPHSTGFICLHAEPGTISELSHRCPEVAIAFMTVASRTEAALSRSAVDFGILRLRDQHFKSHCSCTIASASIHKENVQKTYLFLYRTLQQSRVSARRRSPTRPQRLV